MSKLATDCRGKISYPTQRAAADARQSMILRKQSSASTTGKTNIYACQTCSGWHIGHARHRIVSRPKRGGDRVMTLLNRYRELERGGT